MFIAYSLNTITIWNTFLSLESQVIWNISPHLFDLSLIEMLSLKPRTNDSPAYFYSVGKDVNFL